MKVSQNEEDGYTSIHLYSSSDEEFSIFRKLRKLVAFTFQIGDKLVRSDDSFI